MSYAQFGYSSPSNYQTNSQQVSINVMYFNTTNPITINENIKTIAARDTLTTLGWQVTISK